MYEIVIPMDHLFERVTRKSVERVKDSQPSLFPNKSEQLYSLATNRKKSIVREIGQTSQDQSTFSEKWELG